MKKLTSLLAPLLAIGLSTAAYATPVAGLFNSAPTPTLLSDNSGDLFINVDGSTSAAGTPTVTVGDIIVTIVGINTIGPTTIGSGTIYNELTAITASKIATDNPIPVPGFNPNVQGITLHSYTEAPLTAADTASFDWSTGKILGGLLTFNAPAGASNDGSLIAALYEDSAKNYTRDSTLQNGLTTATDGDLRLEVSLIPANGDSLSAVAPFDLGQIAALLPLDTAITNASVGVDGTITFQNWPFLLFGPNITGGNGGFSSPSATSGWPAFDNLDYTVLATPVPEPTSILLVGMGLLGAAICGRKRRQG